MPPAYAAASACLHARCGGLWRSAGVAQAAFARWARGYLARCWAARGVPCRAIAVGVAALRPPSSAARFAMPARLPLFLGSLVAWRRAGGWLARALGGWGGVLGLGGTAHRASQRGCEGWPAAGLRSGFHPVRWRELPLGRGRGWWRRGGRWRGVGGRCGGCGTGAGTGIGPGRSGGSWGASILRRYARRARGGGRGGGGWGVW